MRNRRQVSDAEVWRFANSWKVGGRKACGRQNEQYRKPHCKSRNRPPCRILHNSEHFGDCDAKLSPTNYYEACLQDMCECPSGNCYCESFAAYAHECTRLGAVLPNWKQSTRCLGNKGFKKRFHEKKREKHRKISSFNRSIMFNADLVNLHKHRTSIPFRLPINWGYVCKQYIRFLYLRYVLRKMFVFMEEKKMYCFLATEFSVAVFVHFSI